MKKKTEPTEPMVTAVFCYEMLALFMMEIEMLRDKVKLLESSKRN